MQPNHTYNSAIVNAARRKARRVYALELFTRFVAGIVGAALGVVIAIGLIFYFGG